MEHVFTLHFILSVLLYNIIHIFKNELTDIQSIPYHIGLSPSFNTKIRT